MQYKVDLTVTDRMVNRCLICCFDLLDLNKFSFFRSFAEWAKNCGLIFHTHITMISAIMIARDCFDAALSIFCYKSSNGGGIEACLIGHFLRCCSLGSQFKSLQSKFRSLILIFLSNFLNCSNLFFAK